jgi:hypothetical protein
MSSQTAIFLMDAAEFILWAALGLLIWKKKLHHRFPAMGGYVALHLASMPALLLLLLLGSVYSERCIALFCLHRGLSLRAFGVFWLAKVGDRGLPLGRSGRSPREFVDALL